MNPIDEFPPKLRAAGTPCNGATAARSFSGEESNMMHDPFLHIELSHPIHQRDPDCVWRPTRYTEADAAPLLRSSALSAGTLTLVMLAIMGWSMVAGLIWLASHVINAVLSV
jgi:hypothetical protein